MRNMTNEALRALFAQNTDQIFYQLLKIDPSVEGYSPIYVYASNETINGEPRIISHHGNDYVATPFEIILPGEGVETSLEITLRVANVGRELTSIIRELTSPLKITLSVILSSDTESIQAGPWDMELVNINGDAIYIEGTIISDRFLDEPFPADKMDAKNFPQMF